MELTWSFVFFEVELLCGKRHRGLHGSHNCPLFIGLPIANIAASVCFAKRRAKNFIYNGLSQRHPARASPSQYALAQPPNSTAGTHSPSRMSACLVLCHRVCRHVAHRVERLTHQRTVCIGGDANVEPFRPKPRRPGLRAPARRWCAARSSPSRWVRAVRCPSAFRAAPSCCAPPSPPTWRFR